MEERQLNTTLKLLHVLYVEDEPMLREEVSAFLKRRVHRLHVAGNGIEALEIMDLYPIDVVITDLLMPKMDGMQLAEEIRRRSRTIPVLIATAINDISVMQSTIALGIERYLIKPIDVTVLVEALSVVAQKKSEERLAANLCPIHISPEQNTKLEAEVAKLVKLTTGKGPELVTVLFQANLLEILIKGSRSKLEQTMLTDDDNLRIIDFLRETYYRHLKSQFRELIHDQTGAYGQLQQILCDSRKDIDRLKWILD